MVAACHDRVNEHDNKLTGVWSAGVSPAQWVSFEYDALGRRVKKTDWSLLTTGDPVRYYLSSGQNEVAEYNGQGQRVRYYVHGPTYIDERVVMHNDPVGGGAPTTGSDYIYLLKDLYTVAGLADERGWPVERYDYDAYGKVHMNRCAVLPRAADFDGDGDVDQNDLTVLLDAYGGSGQAPNGPRGWRADLDGDGDVDGSDYVLFADAYNGAGNPPRPPSPTVSVGSMGLTTSSMVVSRVGNPFFFTGRRLDVLDKQDAGTPHHFTDDYAGLQVYDYRARIMDPVLGRFSQRDPYGLGGRTPTDDEEIELDWVVTAEDTAAVELDDAISGEVNLVPQRERPKHLRNALIPRRLRDKDRCVLQYVTGMGLYEYAASNPVALTDPQGQNPLLQKLVEYALRYGRALATKAWGTCKNIRCTAGIHRPHHGKGWHIQVNCWLKGVKGSGKTIVSIPIPDWIIRKIGW